MLQKKVESMSVILMTQVAEFVKKNIVLKHARKTYNIEIQIDITLRRTASPIGGIMLYDHAVI